MSEAQQMVALYTEAEKKVLQGKSATLGGRSLTYENLSEIREGRKEWERKAAKATVVSTGKSSTYSVARFN